MGKKRKRGEAGGVLYGVKKKGGRIRGLGGDGQTGV